MEQRKVWRRNQKVKYVKRDPKEVPEFETIDEAKKWLQIKTFQLGKKEKELVQTRIALLICASICAILMFALIWALMPPKASSPEEISQEEKELLAKLVWVEAGTESFECQVAIAAVVLNRYHSDDIPYFDTESITSVIVQKYQFAPVDDIDFVNRTAMEAVEAAIDGWDPTREAFPEGALYFYAPKLMPEDFQKGVEVYRIDDVNFHRDYKLPEPQG